jgi:hypothetical protein
MVSFVSEEKRNFIVAVQQILPTCALFHAKVHLFDAQTGIAVSPLGYPVSNG